MKFGRMLVLSLAGLLTVAPAVHAQDDMGDLTTKRPRRQTVEEENNDPARSGPILGVGGTYAIENFDDSGQNNDNSGGFNAHVGYRFNRWVAANLEVERYQQFDGHVGGTDVGEVNGWAVGPNIKGYVLPGRFQPFAEFGINYYSTETTNNTATPRQHTNDGCGLRFGAGLDFYATPKFVLTGDVSYMLGVGETDGYDLIALSFGIAFRP